MEDASKTKQGNKREFFEKTPIDGQTFKSLAEAGLIWLRTNAQYVNNLNVFPVPDGDTGTNMVLTMQAAFQEIANSPEKNLGKIAHDLAHGALMGARGNSGVILSQLLRGFARALDEEPTLTPELMVQALSEARDTAYRGVVRPVEGTILTVAKDIAKAADQALGSTNDLVTFLEWVVTAADESVERTPDLLPVLKDAGVVDSGGKGLFFIFEGMTRYINGLTLDTPEAMVQPLSAMKLDQTMVTVEPGQDYEVIVDFRPEKQINLPQFYEALENMGTSIQVGEGDGLYRVHIHVPTENRYEPIEYTMGLGTITKVYIENLIAQMDEIEEKSNKDLPLAPISPGQIGVVVVSPGDGISRVFASLGVNAIVPGGQTMNPSTQEILSSFENLPTDKIIILPNNKNIIMAAENTIELTVKKVAVIPSKTVPQGLAAMLSYMPDSDFDELVGSMQSAIREVETGEITTATRTVEIDGVNVEKGQIIVLHNGKLVLSSASLEDACLEFFSQAEMDDFELITMFVGDNVEKSLVNQIADKIRLKYPEHEVEVQDGGQPHYQFIFSLE